MNEDPLGEVVVLRRSRVEMSQVVAGAIETSKPVDPAAIESLAREATAAVRTGVGHS